MREGDLRQTRWGEGFDGVLLFNILDVTRFESGTLPQQIDPTEHELIRNLAEVLTSVSGKGSACRTHTWPPSCHDGATLIVISLVLSDGARP